MLAGFQTHVAELSGWPDRLDGRMRETEESEMTPNFWAKQLEGWIDHLQRWEDGRRRRFWGQDQELGVGPVKFGMIIQHSREGVKQAFGCLSLEFRGMIWLET